VPLVRPTAATAGVRERTETRILDAAEGLVAEATTYAELSVAMIGTRAGVSRATFYKYFADKRALAVAIGRRAEGALAQRIDAWLDGAEDLSAPEAMRRSLGVFADHRGAVLLLSEAAGYDPVILDLWNGVRRHFADRAAARALRNRPGLGEATAAARAHVLVWGTTAVLTEHLADPRVATDELLAALAEQWEVGLGEPRGA
jgi:AcrR family transcriptional regulator